MPDSDGDRRESPDTIQSSLAEMLFYLPTAELRAELEQFRKTFEARFGPTDLTKRYTSTWPSSQQSWLIQHEPQSWFRGLPKFAKAYLKEKMQLAAREGRLDQMGDPMIQLFLDKTMHRDAEDLDRDR